MTPMRARLLRRTLAVAAPTAVVLALLLAVPGLQDVQSQIGGMAPGWVLLAIALEILSCLSFTVVFGGFFPGVPARTARRVAWVQMGTSSVLPGGGVGGLALAGWLLHQAGVSRRAVLEGSSGVFFLTSAASVAALGVAGLLLFTGIAPGPEGVLLGAVPAAVAATVLAVALWVTRHRPRTGKAWLRELLDGLELARRVLGHADRRAAAAAGYLLFDIAVLWAAFAALGVTPALTTIALGYLIGALANLIPVPGGVGVLDTGMAACLVLFGAPAAPAIAAVLVYHAILFWTSGLGGLAAYALLHRADSPTPVPTAAAGS